MDLNEDYIKIKTGDLLKQSKLKQHLEKIYIEAYRQNQAICVVNVLNQYIYRFWNPVPGTLWKLAFFHHKWTPNRSK